MAKHTVSCAAKCPYYRCEERHEIFCKGPVDGMAIHVAFAVPAEKKAWMKQFCKASFSDCLVTKALLKAEKELKAD